MEANDMKAMREALLALKELDFNKEEDCYAFYRIIDEALAAPPRNCDRFGGDIDKLREACLRERGLNPEEDFPDVFPEWLLAPSTEKGGAL